MHPYILTDCIKWLIYCFVVGACSADLQNKDPGKDDTAVEVEETCGSDPETAEKTSQEHVDHTYTKTDTCNCQSNCHCDSIARLNNKIIQLENLVENLVEPSLCKVIVQF